MAEAALQAQLAKHYLNKKIRVHKFYDDPTKSLVIDATDWLAIDGVLTGVFDQGIELDGNRIIMFRWIREIDYLGDAEK